MPLPPIIYEDEALLAFDKPAGLPVASASQSETLGALVREHYGSGVSNVQRDDVDVSGLSLWSKTKPALDFLSGQFQAKTAQRLYHAMVVVLAGEEIKFPDTMLRDAAGGVPAELSIDWWIGHDPESPAQMKAFRRNGGQSAESNFVVKESFGKFVLVEARPITGRKHQLRVHLAAAGLPVLNDALYGVPETQLLLSDFKRGYKGGADERPMIRQLALHASEVVIAHPLTRESLTLRVPLPQEFEIALKNLRKFGRGAGRRLSAGVDRVTRAPNRGRG
jgi:23S rRNA pseudouridine1911/1915/1917 synthase|uniref:RluA family pseudouridine synthase n=1 Tax=Cephaloticoccus sp. TaxID=1985742 RepID=UPI00404B997F